MELTTQKCALCAEEIPLTVTDCPYCGARFEITSDGYCMNCHEFRLADEIGNCKTCGKPVADWRVASTFVGEPPEPALAPPTGVTPVQSPTSTPSARAVKPSGNRLAIAILGGILALAGLGIIFWLGSGKLPSASTQTTPSAAGAQSMQVTSAVKISLTSIAAVTPTPARTRTPRPTPTVTPLPAWVAEFAEPHLANISDRLPNFKDDFSNEKNSRYYWNAGLDPGITFENGVMHLTTTKGDINAGGGRVNADTRDFILEYELTPKSLDSSGGVHVIFRYSNSGYYAIGFYQDGTWKITFSDKTGDHTLAAGQSDQIDIDQTLKVDLILRGPEMAFYLNSQPAGYGRADTQKGNNGFNFNINAPNATTSVEIDNVKFWNLNNLYQKSP
jgi:hypothetical protein